MHRRQHVELGVVHIFPDDLFVFGDLRDLRQAWHAAAARLPVDKHGVAVRQALKARNRPQRPLGQFVFGDFPDLLGVLVELDDLVTVAAGDQGVAIGQPDADKRMERHRESPEQLARGIDLVKFLVFAIGRLRHQAVEIGALGSLADLPEGGVGIGDLGVDDDVGDDISLAVDFQNAWRAAAFGDHDVTVRQWLRRMDLTADRCVACPVLPDRLALPGHHFCAAGVGVEDMAVVGQAGVVAVIGHAQQPLQATLQIDHGDARGAGAADEHAMTLALGDRDNRRRFRVGLGRKRGEAAQPQGEGQADEVQVAHGVAWRLRVG